MINNCCSSFAIDEMKRLRNVHKVHCTVNLYMMMTIVRVFVSSCSLIMLLLLMHPTPLHQSFLLRSPSSPSSSHQSKLLLLLSSSLSRRSDDIVVASIASVTAPDAIASATSSTVANLDNTVYNSSSVLMVNGGTVSYGDVYDDDKAVVVQESEQASLFAYSSRKMWGDEEVKLLEELRGAENHGNYQ